MFTLITLICVYPFYYIVINTISDNKLVDLEAEGKPAFPYKAVDPEKEYGFVAVAAGDGIKQLFTDLGVDNVVSGGQPVYYYIISME